MNIVTQSELRAFPSWAAVDEVRGVELEGIDEAINLSKRLGAYALECTETKPKLAFGDEGFDSLIKNIKAPIASEALTVQAQLLRQIATGGIGDETFTFRATDKHAGNALKVAVELPEATVDEAAVRPATRFPEPLLDQSLDWLLTRNRSGSEDDKRIINRLNISYDDKYKKLDEDIINIPKYNREDTY